MSKKPKISVEVSQESYDLYKEYASRKGLRLSQWVRLALDAAAPSVDTGSTKAFQALDEVERSPLSPIQSPRRIEPLPPAPEKVTGPLTERVGLPPGHPCMFQGPEACSHSIMGGRPCRWPAPVATNCSAFVRRTRW